VKCEHRDTGLMKRAAIILQVGPIKLELSNLNADINKYTELCERICERENIQIAPNGAIKTRNALIEGTAIWYAASVLSSMQHVINALDANNADEAAQAAVRVGYLIGSKDVRDRLEKHANAFVRRQSNAGKRSGEVRRAQSHVDHEKIKSVAKGLRRAGYADRNLSKEVYTVLGERGLPQPAIKTIRKSLRDHGVIPSQKGR